MVYGKPKNDLGYSIGRLNRILSSRRLIFNPYTVSDKRLLHIIEQARWGDEYDLVQAVVITFTRLRSVNDFRKYNGIYFKVNFHPVEGCISFFSLANGTIAIDNLHQERSIIGKCRITNEKHVEALVGKRVFISRIIRGKDLAGRYRPAYKMTRLTGKIAKDAAAIRIAMCEAKIEMLNRVLEYPECSLYLDCSRDFFDYKTRILRAIKIIEGYSNTPVPKD